jgi:hypothetical protein
MCDVPVVGWPATETQGDEWALLASDPNAGAANRRNTRLRVSLAAVEKRSMVGSNRLPHTPTERRRRMSREPPMEWDGRRSHASASDVAALRRVVEAAQLHRECVTCWGVASPLAAEALQALHAALDALPASSPLAEGEVVEIRAVQMQFVPHTEHNYPALYVLSDKGEVWCKVWSGKEPSVWEKEELPLVPAVATPAEVEALRRERDALNTDALIQAQKLLERTTACDTLRAEIEALRRDAAKFEASWFDAVAERVAAEADVATLRAANARLREALAPLAAIAQETWDSAPDGSYLEDIGMGSAITLGMCRIARAALQEPTP